MNQMIGLIAGLAAPLVKKVAGAALTRLAGRLVKKTAAAGASAVIAGGTAGAVQNYMDKRSMVDTGVLPPPPLPMSLQNGSSSGMSSVNSLPVTTTGQIANLPEVLTLDNPRVRTFHRAPKGYVIIKNPATGQYYGAVRRDVAKRLKLWKPSAKPPISATEWKHFKSAEKVTKKLTKIATHNLHMHKKHTTATHAVAGRKKRK